MGDAADDVYEAAERNQAAWGLFMDAVRRDCAYSMLGRKPCRMMQTPDEHLDALPLTCAHCGRKFDYP